MISGLQQLGRFLSGKKTYLATIALGMTGLLWSAGYLSNATAEALGVIFASAAGISLRAGISKIEKR